MEETITSIDRSTAKALRTILNRVDAKKGAYRGEYTHVYLHGDCLATVTDGRVILRVRVPELMEVYGDFLRETGRVVVLRLEGNALVFECEVGYGECFLTNIDRVIPSDIGTWGRSSQVVNPWATSSKPTKKMDDAMLVGAILSTGNPYDPDLFGGMDCRPWSEMAAMGSRGNRVCFRTIGADELFMVNGMAVEAFR